MNDILMMLISAMGAVAGAALILFAGSAVVTGAVAAVGGVVTSAVSLLPGVACAGGIAFAASQTGYSGP